MTRGSTSRAAAGSSNVRRNLFHHHLGRRPTSASTSTSATTVQASHEENSTDIVIRDKNGNYQVDIPQVPAVGDGNPGDEAKEKESLSHEFDQILYTNRIAHQSSGNEAKLVEQYRNRTRQPSEPAGE